MGGIDSELYKKIREAIMDSYLIDTEYALSNDVMSHPKLRTWRNGIPQTLTHRGRVEGVIYYLANRYNTDGENALALFLGALSMIIHKDNELRPVLAKLSRQVMANSANDREIVLRRLECAPIECQYCQNPLDVEDFSTTEVLDSQKVVIGYGVIQINIAKCPSCGSFNHINDLPTLDVQY